MKKTILAVSLALSFASAFSQEAIKLRFSHVTTATSPKGQGAEKFKELAEQYTAGKVKVEIGDNGSMFGDRDEVNAIKEGNVEMLAPSTTKMSGFYKDPTLNPYVVFDMPYLFETQKDLTAALSSDVFTDMAKTLDAAPINVLSIWDNGFKQLSTNKVLTKYSDLEGLKPRIQPSILAKEQFKAWGANPRAMAYNELTTNALYGSVDSAENPASNFYGSKLMPSQKYLYKTNHGYLGYVIMVNKKFWTSLPADIRTQLEKAMKDATVFESDAATRDNTSAFQSISATGLTRVLDINPEITKEMKASSKRVDNFLSPTQKEVLGKLVKVIKADRVKRKGTGTDAEAKPTEAKPVAPATPEVKAPAAK